MQQEQKLLNFLLVEDNDDHAELIRCSLQQKRVSNQFTRAADGVEAMEILHKQEDFPEDKKFDIVLLDLNLPKKSGLEVLMEIKRDPKLMSLPVVVLTTSAAEVDRMKAYQYQANSYLVKPIDFEQFLKMIEDLGLYWGVWNWGPGTGRSQDAN